MSRFTLAFAGALALAVSASASELPSGTWSFNAGSTKGELVVTEVKGTRVKAKFAGDEVVGHWNGSALTIDRGFYVYEGYLLSEPAGEGKTKYTLAGVVKTRDIRARPTRFGEVTPPAISGGWYAQIVADTPAPTGEIQAEVRGVLVVEGTKAYVAVKRKNAAGEVDETRVHVHASEGEWKLLKQTLRPLNGKEVIVKAPISQMKGKGGSVPEGALYFLGKFEPQLAHKPK